MRAYRYQSSADVQRLRAMLAAAWQVGGQSADANAWLVHVLALSSWALWPAGMDQVVAQAWQGRRIRKSKKVVDR